MNGQSTTTNMLGKTLLPGLVLCLISGLSYAQVPVDEDGNPIAYSEQDASSNDAKPVPAAPLGAIELEELVGPIALYPDDLLAIVLPASTYPLEIVQAARFLELLEEDSELKPDEDWDESVVALLNYPDVVRMMNADIDWTWKLGDAVISQQPEVIAAVETFRDKAYAAGNLKSDERQTVSSDEGAIEIVPVDDEIIYVPYYEPEEVVVYQPRPVYHYYPDPYPSYYYPYPSGYRFHSRFHSPYFWGVTTAFSIGWSNHYLNVYHPTYFGHPYYGHTYYGHYYRRPSISIYNTWYVNNNRYSSSNRYRDGDYWRPRSRAGSRQAEPRVRNYHYPPGGDQRLRENTAGRTRLATRDNGRMNLNLRERSDADRRRVATRGAVGTDRQNRVAGGARSTDRAAIATRGANGATTNRGRTDATRRTENANRQQTRIRSRDDTDRSAIQFRDRSANRNRGSAVRPSPNRTTTRRSAPRQPDAGITANRPARVDGRVSSSRQAANTRSPANRPSIRSSGGAIRAPSSAQSRVAAPRTRAPANTRSRSVSPGASRPAVQQRPAQRSVVPNRSSAPRASAPTRRAAPRVNAPRASAPRVSAPPSNRSSNANRSSSRGSSSAPRSSSAGSRQSSRRGASRPRNN